MLRRRALCSTHNFPEDGMYDFELTKETRAKPEEVWAIYTDVANWPEWNDGIERVEFGSSFETGARGIAYAKSVTVDRPVHFELESVEPGRSYEVVWNIGPLLKTRMRRTVEATPTGARLTHSYSTEGILAVFSFINAATAHSRTESSMERIVEAAEARSKT